MTEREISRELRRKYENPDMPCRARRAIRKHKLRGRFRHRLDAEIARTSEKLELLHEIRKERR